MKISAFETTALSRGTLVRQYSVADCVGFDHQGCLYRAECVDTDVSHCLYEFLPAGLAVRGPDGIHALRGKEAAFDKAKTAHATRLRAAGLVGHPALPTLTDIWEENGTVYAVGPWAPGRSLLTELSRRHGSVDNTTLEHWVRSLCDALSALHRHDMVHGNLSVGMIRLLDSGELMLPLLGNGVHTEDVPPWVAPEQHPLNPRPAAVGSWTDIYQMSAVVHQIMTGVSPPTVLRRWEGAAPFERMEDLHGRCPEGLLRATRHGLSMHVTARPQTAQAWLAEAGFPDRRERPRHVPDGTVHPSPADAGASAGRRAVSAPDIVDVRPRDIRQASAPAVPGHQPLSEAVEDRLDRLESPPPTPATTPTWVWLAAAVAIAAVLGIVTMS